MNTGRIKKTKTLSLPDFPATNKTTRVVTKHFTNLAMYLERDQLSLLNWLVYNCGMDNKIKYSTVLLQRYAKSVEMVQYHYGSKVSLRASVPLVRKEFQHLIEVGYVISYGDEFFLNPMLSYQADYVTAKEYKIICAITDERMIGAFCAVVNKKTKKG